MLLLTLDIDGTTRRVSDEELSLTYPWYAEVAQAPSVKYATDKLYGGFCKPSYGGFTLIPGVTRERTLGATLQFTNTDESGAVTLMTGTAHRATFDRNGVVYSLLKPEYDVTVKTNITGTLQSVFTTYCGASYLNRTLDVTGTSRNPAVSYNVTSDTQVADVLSEIAAFFCHGFYDDGTTIYLYDCLTDNGTLSIDEFDFEPAAYEDQQAVSEFKAGNYAIDGSYSHGSDFNVSPVCHTVQANIEAALGDIKTIMEQPGASLRLPLTDKTKAIKPGMKISWTDESMPDEVTAWIRVQSITYDFAATVPTLVVYGLGGVA